MKSVHTILIIATLLTGVACEGILEPRPVDRITNDQVLKDASSARTVLTGIYRDFANLGAPTIVAGDLTADLLVHNGTFVQYLEISDKEMSASNGSAGALWGVIYGLNFSANFLLEGLPELDNVSPAVKEELSATARFLRGYAYFIGTNTYDGIPLATTTSIAANRDIPRASKQEILAFVEEDLLFALDKVPADPFNQGEVSNGAVKAALARFYLYQENWSEAEKYATEIIDGIGVKTYFLEPEFADVLTDFSNESILEIVYSANDNPGTSTNFGINNLFEARREIIPSTDIIQALKNNGGDRIAMIEFNSENASGTDNGWTITRYGPFDNIPVLRLGEVYLIRAEARTQLNQFGAAVSDINAIRERSGLSPISGNSQNLLLGIIEEERRVEMAFEGHRWYDLKRTGKVDDVMRSFSPKWDDTDKLWPIPLREIQNNPSLNGQQNPGY